MRLRIQGLGGKTPNLLALTTLFLLLSLLDLLLGMDNLWIWLLGLGGLGVIILLIKAIARQHRSQENDIKEAWERFKTMPRTRKMPTVHSYEEFEALPSSWLTIFLETVLFILYGVVSVIMALMTYQRLGYAIFLFESSLVVLLTLYLLHRTLFRILVRKKMARIIGKK